MKTLLIIDDEFSLVESLTELLSWEGYEVVTAANGRQGLEQLERSSPALVLLDYMMPVMDGMQVLRSLRSNPAYRDLPVVLMTAAPMGLPPHEKGWTALLRKPFTAADVLRVIERLLGDSRGDIDRSG
ncbi:MAG TPA: response regulator [Polyangia bacterium]|jgi:CheY-like chemotaxis protein|nr:response regulator [Polyangia bacterium]